MKCAKIRFDLIGAKMALAKIANKDNAKKAKQEKRYYKCQKCHGYHLTSQQQHWKKPNA